MSLLDDRFQTPGEHESTNKRLFPNWGGDCVTLLLDPLLPRGTEDISEDPQPLLPQQATLTPPTPPPTPHTLMFPL